MHHDRVGARKRELVERQAVAFEVFLRRWEELTLHALALQAQHHHHIAVTQAFAHVVKHLHAERLDASG